ncbi:hypothetical protein NM688_g4882 [Phlebia brevispora]|uniref:Uncharacterized protein n=1 Tax=Phlebia brevispora TaxID=194682 RepID=A0ACC1T1P7_9APHY|nr:hypothetical protein NM688_g4882 [Phlebia brevispora]
MATSLASGRSQGNFPSASLPDVQSQQTEEEREYGALFPHEEWWRDHQKWLESKGYMLRSRYHPDWVPSWKAKGIEPDLCEDANGTLYDHLLDATRIVDGKMVMLKRITDATHPHELELTRYFSTEPIASHPRNHCIRLLEVFDVPDETGVHIMVLPLLRSFNSPSFKTVGEAVDCFSQVFEAVQFMHQCNVAHRDCMDLNIMLDPEPLYPDMFHPRQVLLTKDSKSLAKHYSHMYDPARGPPLARPIWGGDKTVPEFKRNYHERINPFPVDIYYIGNMVRESFLQASLHVLSMTAVAELLSYVFQKYHGIEFMVPLVEDMTQDDPSKRPTIDEVIRRFEDSKRKLPWWKLRSRLVKMDEEGLYKALRGVGHFFKTIGYIATLRSAIPTP